MIYLSAPLIASPPADFTANSPRLGWHNLVTETNVTATSSATGFPASYVGIPATFLYWKANTSASEQTLTVTFSTAQDVDYVAFAAHNLGSTGAEYIVEYWDGDSWESVDSAVQPSTDFAIIHEFTSVLTTGIRVRITPGTAAPQVGVLYAGEILRMQRSVYVGYTPYPFSAQTTVSTGFSESGQFIGRVVRKVMYQNSVSFQNIKPDWMRQDFSDFIVHARSLPFFWAWRPSTYPAEVGYVASTGDVQPSNQRPNGMMSVDISMRGIR